jgi:hypothetical protein
LHKNYQHFAALDMTNCPSWRPDPASAVPDCSYARLCNRNRLPFARGAV